MAEQVEIKILLDAEIYDELAMKSEALGQTAEKCLTGAILREIEAQRIRYANMQARLQADRAATSMVQVVRTGGGK